MFVCSMDSDNNESITLEEMTTLFHKHDVGVPESTLFSIFRHMDTDMSNTITFDEFRTFFQYAWTYLELQTEDLFNKLKINDLWL